VLTGPTSASLAALDAATPPPSPPTRAATRSAARSTPWWVWMMMIVAIAIAAIGVVLIMQSRQQAIVMQAQQAELPRKEPEPAPKQPQPQAPPEGTKQPQAITPVPEEKAPEKQSAPQEKKPPQVPPKGEAKQSSVPAPKKEAPKKEQVPAPKKEPTPETPKDKEAPPSPSPPLSESPKPPEPKAPAPRTPAELLADGEGAWSEQRYAEAVKIWEPLATSGNARAQERMGNVYWEGKGAERDAAKARTWYERAANGGETGAMMKLCAMFADGKDPNNNVAYMWCGVAAEMGSSAAAAERDKDKRSLQPAEQQQGDRVIKSKVDEILKKRKEK